MNNRLNSMNLRLSHERARLENARTAQEKEIRQVWVSQIEKEIEHEKKVFGIVDIEVHAITDEDLLNQLRQLGGT